MKRVVARIQGGLGNQLFCYAAARRLALHSGAELVLDTVTGFVRDLRYRRRYALDPFNVAGRIASPWDRLEPFERPRRALAKARARLRPFETRQYLTQEGPDFDARLLARGVEGTLYLDGLWQSERYFADVADTIRRDLTITPPTDEKNRAAAERIRALDAPVSIHVRFFQAPGSASDQNASVDYYRRAIARVSERLGAPHFVLFSDRPQDARELLPLPPERTLVIDHNDEHAAHADMWLMTQCRHFITANSTFSWWGAWLSPSPDKHILTPSPQTIPHPAWTFAGLIPDAWEQL